MGRRPSIKRTTEASETLEEKNLVSCKMEELIEAVPEDMPNVIRCTLKKLPKYNLPLDKYQTDLKLGRYDYSAANFEGYGRSKFQVCVSIIVDWKPLIEKYPRSEIVKRCMKYLFGRPMLTKVRNKDKEVWPFGIIDPEPQWYNFVETDGQPYISLMMITDMKDCQFFHGEGFTW
jgi:hypothetical protein